MALAIAPQHAVTPSSIPILFDASDVVAVSKPEGVACIRERREGSPFLQRMLSEQLGCRLFVVHRLDKDVSGVFVFARTPEAHRNLSLQFERREVEKTYVALVFGTVVADGGMIDFPLREFGSGRVAVDRSRGKPCRTEFRVLDQRAGWTLVEVKPRTGRRHQIRAHFYSIGHPIAGDPLYGDQRSRAGMARLMLHAESIAFRLLDGRATTVDAPRPESFARVIEASVPPAVGSVQASRVRHR